ncbi:unnamed protein product [Macrosiphum euphorbiae]|uniref:Uncharacterized protein n=1 Tax=Macrosiphum euphorbiae TaxID=13131 RepID=A0AAV0X3V6_9HEMI|nr:unnamed protein product [Macrosiphum euphorbiae]
MPSGRNFRGPELSVAGFHSSQSLWRKIQELGLTRLYKTHRKVYDFFRMAVAIALLPPENTWEGFMELKLFSVAIFIILLNQMKV